MKILVEELKTTLTHTATAVRRMSIQALRPYIYKHLSPSGSFTLSLKQGGSTLGSATFTSADIEAIDGVTALNYFHGAYKVEFTDPVIVNRGEFEIELSHSGYTFAESAYLGWIREHERIINPFTSTGNDAENPLAVEIWVNK